MTITITKSATEYVCCDPIVHTQNGHDGQVVRCIPVESNARFYPNNMMWCFHNNNNGSSEQEFMPIEQLQSSLRRVCENLPLLCGTTTEDQYGNIQLHLNNTGVLFTVAKANAPLATIIPPASVRYAALSSQSKLLTLDYAPLNGLSLHTAFPDTVGSNVLSVQLTRFTCNSLVIAISAHHSIFDASVSGQFIRMWATFNRQLCTSSSSSPPTLPTELGWKTNYADRTFIMEDVETQLQSPLTKKVERPLHCAFKKNIDTATPPSTDPPLPNVVMPKLISGVLHFSAEEVEAIKLAASKALQGKEYISSYAALYAHCLQAIHKAQNSPPSSNGSLHVLQSMNARRLFGITEDNNFFGMFAFWLSKDVPEAYITDQDNLSLLTKEIHSTIASQSKSDVIQYNNYLQPISTESKYRENLLDADIIKRDFHTTQWAKLGYYTFSDFGYGPADYSGPVRHVIPKVMIQLDAPPMENHSFRGFDLALALWDTEWAALESQGHIHKYRKTK